MCVYYVLDANYSSYMSIHIDCISKALSIAYIHVHANIESLLEAQVTITNVHVCAFPICRPGAAY